MKNGRTLVELATEIQRQQDSKKDFLVPTNKIQAYAATIYGDQKDLELAFGTTNMRVAGSEGHFMGQLTDNGHNQLGQFCGIPAKYYDLMRSSSAELLAQNVKYWLEKSSDRRTIRTLDGNIRAILSDSYRRLDNFDLAQSVLPMLYDAHAQIESCQITENKLYIKAITHKVQAEVSVGDVVSAGVLISNSETGHGSLSVKPLIYRLVCSNGAIADKYAMKKYHAGRVHEMEQIQFSNDTLNAEDKAFWLKVRDLVKHSLSEVTFKKIVEEMTASKAIKIEEPTRAIELATKAYAFNENEKTNVLKHLIEGGDLSSWGLGNAVTRM
ncbi:MAG: DUF932 domain-containing protein, partial [Burkholderiaceae bacterium]|nr:DUF932 domain-containing protein [Burkholderiaceae bacterium]